MFEAGGPGYSTLKFVFDHFSNQIYYPCYVGPEYKLDARVYVVPTGKGYNVTSISIESQSPAVGTWCPAISFYIGPVSFNLLSWDSTGQRVSLELQYFWNPRANMSMRGLDARIHNSTWSYEIQFANINATHPLPLGGSATQAAFMNGSPLRPSVIYDVTATGTLVNGTRLISNFKIQLQT